MSNEHERLVPRIEAFASKWWHNRFLWFGAGFVILCVVTWVLFH